MSLRTQVAADLKTILEDTDGFGWAITVTDPAGTSASLTGLSTDIGLLIDPETGIAVSGRRASIAIALASLSAASLSIPAGVASPSSKPWVVTFADVAGTSHTFKIQEAMPDRAAGVVTCILEAYRS